MDTAILMDRLLALAASNGAMLADLDARLAAVEAVSGQACEDAAPRRSAAPRAGRSARPVLPEAS
jgi:hypothetical protein